MAKKIEKDIEGRCGGMSKYREIVKLYEYCKKIGVNVEISPMFGGFCIKFENGGDVIQHLGSYGRDCGCVEPAIGSRLDYTAVPLKNAKALIRRHKEKLNRVLKGGTEG
jgi:hypothetical protein